MTYADALLEATLKEMPFSGIGHNEIRFADQNRFKDSDKRYVGGPKYPAILTKKLERVPFPFFIYISDTNSTRDRIGMISDMNRVYSVFYDLGSREDRMDIMAMTSRKALENMVGHPDAVHMMIAHNDPRSEDWQPLTPWMILHRLGHACLDRHQMGHDKLQAVKDVREIFAQMVDNLHITDISRMLPFKSARMDLPDYDELLVEMFAAYCYGGGKLKLTPVENPTSRQRLMIQFAKTLEHLYGLLIPSLKGKLWVG